MATNAQAVAPGGRGQWRSGASAALRRWRADPLLLIGIAALVAQGAALVLWTGRPGGLDPISLGMAVLAGLCCWRTWTAAPPSGAAGHWRWRAAMAGWMLWTAQWTVGALETVLLDGDQQFTKLLVLANRVAFIVALVPLASPGDPRLLRGFDILLGIAFASLLTLLTWPDLPQGVQSGPNHAFLYLGYVAMPVLAAVSIVAQRSTTIRPLSRALFWTLVGYGATGIAMRELYEAGMVAHESVAFLIGDFAFLAYLALLPARASVDPRTSPADTIVRERLVPLLLTALTIALAFGAVRVAPAVGIVAALLVFAVYAARTTLTENLHHAAQGARMAAMIDMMHEIRSPLGVILLNVALLRRGKPLDPREERILGTIDAGCTSVATLLDNVLSLERLEAGLVPPAIETHDVARIVRDTVTLLEARWRAAGVAVQGPDAPFPAAVDQAAMQRIVMNLLGNAIRFTPAGGVVAITLARARDGATVLSVQDNGTGMDDAVQARLFQRFATVGQPLHGPRGTGLGLSISLALARTMGGTIEAASREGVGTTMKVTIPSVR